MLSVVFDATQGLNAVFFFPPALFTLWDVLPPDVSEG